MGLAVVVRCVIRLPPLAPERSLPGPARLTRASGAWTSQGVHVRVPLGLDGRRSAGGPELPALDNRMQRGFCSGSRQEVYVQDLRDNRRFRRTTSPQVGRADRTMGWYLRAGLSQTDGLFKR